jgi:hypothetical protein
MSLPILKHPTFDLTVPSSKQKLTYRPFLVKEEKILLLSQESDKLEDLIRAVKQIINNCIVEGEIDLDNAPTFDIEYIFLRLRANSVSDLAKFILTDEESKNEIKIELDLKEVEIIEDENHSSIIQLTDSIKLQMKYPTYTVLAKHGLATGEGVTVDATFSMIKSCIDKVVVGSGEDEEAHEFKDYSDKEVDEFLESLTSQNFKEVQSFFDTMPKLQHEVKYKDGKKTKTKIFSGLADFFQSA